MKLPYVVRHGVLTERLMEIDEEEPLLIQAVADNKKLACSVVASKEAYELASSLELYVRRAWCALFQFPGTSFSSWVISRHEKVSDVPFLDYLEEHFSDLPDVARRARGIILDLQDWYIADALAFCSAYPRIKDNGEAVYKDNIERPEITLFQGFLYGFAPCCVRATVGFAHFGEEKKEETPRDIILGFRCLDCFYGHQEADT